MGRKLRTHLDLLVPDIGGRVRMRQNLQKHSHDLHAKDKQFQENDPVMAKNFSQGPLWITGKILKKSGAVTFYVVLGGRNVVCMLCNSTYLITHAHCNLLSFLFDHISTDCYCVFGLPQVQSLQNARHRYRASVNFHN